MNHLQPPVEILLKLTDLPQIPQIFHPLRHPRLYFLKLPSTQKNLPIDTGYLEAGPIRGVSGVLPKVGIAGSSQEKLVNHVPEGNVFFYHYADILADGNEVGVNVVAEFVEGFQLFLNQFERAFGRGVG